MDLSNSGMLALPFQALNSLLPGLKLDMVTVVLGVIGIQFIILGFNYISDWLASEAVL